MQKVAIVGANGFIGQHLVRKLKAKKNIELSLFGRSDKKVGEDEFQKIDFSDDAKIKGQFQNIDIIYYLISETIPSNSWNNPMLEVEKNLVPFISFLETISSLNVKRVAYISSAGTVYGTTSGKVPEDFDKKPFSPYGIMKLTMENFLRYYEIKHGIRHDIYRVSNVYGEGQNTAKGLGVINTFLESIVNTGKIKLFGDGNTTRNYIYAGDVAELLTHSVKSSGESCTFNISSDVTLTLNNLIDQIKALIPEKFEVERENQRQSDNSYIDLDNSLILKEYPEFKFTPLSEGIKRTHDSIKR